MVAQGQTIRLSGYCPTAERIRQQRDEQLAAMKRLRDIFTSEGPLPKQERATLGQLSRTRGIPSRFDEG